MNLPDIAARTLRACRRHGVTLTTVESCTGGLVSAAITDVSGASDVFERAFVTYSNDAKRQMVGVLLESLKAHGAVSEAIAREMAEGGLSKAGAGVAVALTGIAGPGGGTDEKPVGLVYIACAVKGGGTVVERKLWKLLEPGADRQRIRELSARAALELVVRTLDQEATASPRP